MMQSAIRRGQYKFCSKFNHPADMTPRGWCVITEKCDTFFAIRNLNENEQRGPEMM